MYKISKLPSLNCLNTIKKYFCIPFVVFGFLSCNERCKESIDLSGIDAQTKVTRTEKALFTFKSPEDALAFLKKYPAFANSYFQKSAFPHDSLLANYLFRFYANKDLRNLYNSTDSSFGDLSSLKIPMDNFFAHIKYYYPNFRIPDLYTVVSGFQFEKDIAINDSVIVVSLDYFLGKTAKFRPPFYNYFLERYEKEYIIPMVALGISGKFNQADLKDETMLANMIYYGKAYYFTQMMLPCTPDSLIVQYSGKQMEEVNQNQQLIWGHFIENKLLYEVKPQTIEKYVGESPKVNEIGEKCPGRIGRWLGWQIVKKYAQEHPELSLQALMAEKDAQKIFRLSKYKPEKK